MEKIVDLTGKEIEVNCMACDIQSGKIDLPITRMAETEHFVVEQDLEIPIDGFLIVVSKRHIYGIDEFTEEEEEEFMKIMKRSRQVMEKVLKIEKITIVQEEATLNSHFHVWLFPWHEWMIKQVKPKIENIRPMMEYARNNLMNEKSLKKLEASSQKMKKIF